MIIDKDTIKILLIILIVGLGIGYAYINSDLNINGTAQINSANWDVHWANLQVSDGSVSGSNVVVAPTISDPTTVNYSIVLPTPGSFFEITVDAVNAGSVDAMLDTLGFKINGVSVLESPVPDYIECNATYFDYTPLELDQELKANTSEKYRVWIRYKDDIDASQLPSTDQAINMEFTITYRQATDAAIPIRTYLYRAIQNEVPLYGNPGTSIYTSAQDLLNSTSKTIFLRHRVQEHEIVESSVGFTYNNSIYYLHGGATNYADISPYYEENKALLLSLFGSSNCEEIEGSKRTFYSCFNENYSASKNGYVVVRDGDNWECHIYEDGTSACADENTM